MIFVCLFFRLLKPDKGLIIHTSKFEISMTIFCGINTLWRRLRGEIGGSEVGSGGLSNGKCFTILRTYGYQSGQFQEVKTVKVLIK